MQQMPGRNAYLDGLLGGKPIPSTPPAVTQKPKLSGNDLVEDSQARRLPGVLFFFVAARGFKFSGLAVRASVFLR